MPDRTIVITSDFGDRFTVTQLVGVIRSINSAIPVIAGENNVTPFSIVEGSFIIWQSSRFFPPGTIHLGIVDPGVGSSRRGIIIESKNFFFVGPDNGLFYQAAKADGIVAAYTVDLDRIGNTSVTFHGRDVFAKAAAFVAHQRPFDEFAHPLDTKLLVPLEYKENQIVHIDPYGNLKIYNPAAYTQGQSLTITIGEKRVAMPFKLTFSEVAVGEYLAYKGSHDILEIAINQGHAAKSLGVRVEDVLQITS